MAMPELPEEMLINIFSRLPVKSVGKCRCLATRWRTLLSTPKFIKSHLIQNSRRENLILISTDGFVRSVVDGTVSRKLELPDDCARVAGPCDGLVLLVTPENVKYVVNPITLMQVKINDSLALKKVDHSDYGFGYDRKSNDYKIVALSTRLLNRFSFVDVYSVKLGVWKRIHNLPYEHISMCGAFVNNAIHWLVCGPLFLDENIVLAFDLADEVFVKMPAPRPSGFDDVEQFVLTKLVVIEGCLCLVYQTIRQMELWIMKEYGVPDSWTKYSIDADVEFGLIKPLCFVGDEEVVLLTEEKSLSVYNLKWKAWTDMVVDGVPTVLDGGTFVESLVSPAECCN
ncbi:hypothetical protein C2S51_032666 [Perilla frutescens var. frutescens]|nr:hypothetical protein C2S51_032666 [Perilla frutescens var. frutescens]